MISWSFYDPQTGLFSGQTHGAPDASHLAANTPSGTVALLGLYDHLSQQVDVSTGAVIAYQPPSPGAEFVWDAPSSRWRLSAAAQAAQGARKAAAGRIAQLEASQHRALRELALGSTTALARLQSIDAQIVALRAAL
jgi:hypothetical protein